MFLITTMQMQLDSIQNEQSNGRGGTATNVAIG
jgi:hypothetical protein